MGKRYSPDGHDARGSVQDANVPGWPGGDQYVLAFVSRKTRSIPTIVSWIATELHG